MEAIKAILGWAAIVFFGIPIATVFLGLLFFIVGMFLEFWNEIFRTIN
jgi:hypothetical protein